MRRAVILPLIVSCLAFAARVMLLTRESLWRDEVDSVRFALEPAETLLSRLTAIGFNGPLYFLLLRGWFALVGVNDFTLRYFSALAGVALVALSYALGRRLFGRAAGVAAQWITASSPLLVWYAGEGRMYALQPALLALAMYALLRAIGPWQARRAAWWATFVVATSLSFYVHVLSPLVLVVALVAFVALWRTARVEWRRALVALALLTLPYLPLAAWQAPALLAGGGTLLPAFPLDAIASTVLRNWMLGLDAGAPLFFVPSPAARRIAQALVLGALLSAIAVWFLQVLRRSTHRRFALVLAAWAVLPTALLSVISSLRAPLFLPRYVLWSSTPFYVLLGAACAHLQWRVALLALCTAAHFCGLAAQVVNPIRPELRGAVAHVLREAQPGEPVVLQIGYLRHAFAYYAAQHGASPLPVRLVEAPYANESSLEAVGAQLEAQLAGASSAWLFESESQMWDRQGHTRRWFETRWVLREQRLFHGVSLMRFARRAAQPTHP